ncbi:MAG: proline--tRNA ligase [Treponemataceae bacterium]
MKATQTMISTLREVPSEAVITSHQLMLRAGIIRKLGNGLFAYLPLGLRSFRKIENIIRQEMDAIGSLEFKPPVVVPAELWQESGRFETMGQGLLRATNRVDQQLVISPTAEEAFTALIRDELDSYKQLPIIAYQINTKYRDEIRPRYGVMRGREFVMKDAYSFHATQESLDAVYSDFAKAYRNIFKRCGLSVIPVSADSGAMGGNGSEEFMVESTIGDNTLILCKKCDYAANDEKAACANDTPEQAKTEKSVEVIDTPNVKTIEELSAFLKTSSKSFIKTLIYKALNCELSLDGVESCKNLKKENHGAYKEVFFAVCIRGDLEVNEVKLASALKASEVELASDADVEKITNAPVGFAGPVHLKSVPIIIDESVSTMHDAITGALQKDKHFAHVELNRDFTPFMTSDIRTVKEGDICPHCSGEFYTKKGNELGHIFKLGNKYTKSMNVMFLDENGKQQIPTMGCYGIGLDRTLASIIEEHNDENGIIWPMSIAPFQVAIVPIKYDGKMKEIADTLYADLVSLGVEVLLDDRDERTGVKFKDMDLIGIPLRVVIGEKNLPLIEIKMRKNDTAELVDMNDASSFIVQKISEEIIAI